MKFGLCIPQIGTKISSKDLVTLAVAAEAGGFDSVFVTDHIIMPESEIEPYGELLEPFVTLAFIAAKTSTLKLGTSILVIPQRNPILVAKQVAALDQFSGGRVILGLGAGWAEGEFEFLNADFKNRGKVFDESISLMRKLWMEDRVNFSGRFFNVTNAVFLPKPIQAHLPIWVGGTSDSAIRRAAKLANGWHPIGVDPERLKRGADRIHRSGREVTISMRITTDVRKRRDDYVSATGEKRVSLSGSRGEILKRLEEYERAGLDYLVPYIFRESSVEIVADIKQFASEIMGSYS
jgi:probable F420-dependent oxidoreductase